MFKILLMICLGVCYVQCETPCQTTLNTCFKAAFDQLKASEPPKPDHSAINAEAAQCFTVPGCTAPPPKNHTKPDYYGRFECFKKGGDIIQACVQQTYPSFSFPTPPPNNGTNDEHHFDFGRHGWDHNGGDHGHMEGHQEWSGKGKGKGHGDNGKHHGNGKANDYVLLACNNDTDKAKAVEDCLSGVKNKSIEAWKAAAGQQQQHQNPKKRFCEIKNNCTAQLTPECKAETANIKAALCQCATNHTEDIRAAVSTCITPPPTTAPVTSDAASVNNRGFARSKGFNPFNKEHKQFSIAEMFCKECEEGGNDAEGHAPPSHNNGGHHQGEHARSGAGNNADGFRNAHHGGNENAARNSRHN